MTNYHSGLPTAVHDTLNAEASFARIYDAVAKRKGQRILDIFAGGGRHIARMFRKMDGNGQFIAIDADPLRIRDMLAKNSLATEEGAPRYAQALTPAELIGIFGRGEIAVIQGELPEHPCGDTGIDLTGTVDFVLCHAGIMFVPPSNIERTVHVLASMLAAGGELCLRYSLHREDQVQNYGRSYFIHAPELIEALLANAGLSVTRHENFPDTLNRGFSWLDFQVSKPSAG